MTLDNYYSNDRFTKGNYYYYLFFIWLFSDLFISLNKLYDNSLRILLRIDLLLFCY